MIDDTLILDAGGLTSSLSIEAQIKLKAILLTHSHYDHVRDIPALGMNFYLNNSTLNIYTTQPVYESLTRYLLNDYLYPNWFQKQVFTFTPIEPLQSVQVYDYSILAVPVNHPVPAVGYQVTGPDGKSLFYTGDTGINLSEVWKIINPQILIIECTAPDRYEASVGKFKHLTPGLLRQELMSFREIKGYLPRVILIHITPWLETEIVREVAEIARTLAVSIEPAHEGMKLTI